MYYGWGDRSEWVPVSRWFNQEGQEVWLSSRQLQCLIAALELGTEEAAYVLGITPKTLKSHLTKLFRKLVVYNKWEAASALGWVQYPRELMDAPLGAYATPAGGPWQDQGAVARQVTAPTTNGEQA